MWTFNTALVLLASCLLGSLLDTVRYLVITPTTGLMPARLSTQAIARQPVTLRTQPATLRTQPATICTRPATSCTQVEAVARNGGCELLRLLGRALPSQSSFFINFLLQARARYLVITLPSQSSCFTNFLVQARYLVITGRVSWLSPLLLINFLLH